KAAQLEEELSTLDSKATDASKVEIPADKTYDAEITTTVDGETHHHRRDQGTKIWCRFSPGPDCGEPVRHTLDDKVNETLKAKQGKGKGAEPPAPDSPEFKQQRAEAIAERAKAAEKA